MRQRQPQRCVVCGLCSWAWAQAGITGLYGHGINAFASSFRTWGSSNNRWHPIGDGYVPQPGDVAQYSDQHVGIYTGGPANSPTVINGNWAGGVGETANQTTNGAGAALSGYTTAPTGGIYPDGSFVNDTSTGAVYRIAGGAPIYVSTWNAVGGPKATTPIDHAKLLSLPAYPANGTLVSTNTGGVYKIAGGAPIYVSDWNAIGGQQATIGIDQWSVNNAGSIDSHLLALPANGTLVSTNTGGVYKIAGGAPIYVSDWNAIGGQQATVGIDQWSVNNAGIPDTHLRPFPAEGTLVNTNTGGVYKIAGGAPIYVSNWSAIGGQQATVGIDQWSVNNAGIQDTHMRAFPVDGTFLETNTGAVYRVAGGAPIYLSSWSAYGGPQPRVTSHRPVGGEQRRRSGFAHAHIPSGRHCFDCPAESGKVDRYRRLSGARERSGCRLTRCHHRCPRTLQCSQSLP